MAESELGLLESFSATKMIFTTFMHDCSVNLGVSTLGRCSRLAGNHLRIGSGLDESSSASTYFHLSSEKVKSLRWIVPCRK